MNIKPNENQNLTIETLIKAAHQWRNNDPDPSTVAELDALLSRANEPEIQVDFFDRFSSKLEFGTAGLRGLLGAGPNRMNRAVVICTTAGLAQYLIANNPNVQTQGVVVGCDARRMSAAFVEDTVRVLTAYQIPVFIFDRIVATPIVSFAVRELNAAAGVMITASHNPPEYNGYKVYWSNAAQIIPPHDKGIAAQIDAIDSARNVTLFDYDQARIQGLLQEIKSSLFEQYYEAIAQNSLHQIGRSQLSIVYTPMHGVGGYFVKTLFEKLGFHQLFFVPTQAEPDAAFPTVRFPNPEEPGALDLAFAFAKQKHADIILANDPDADRLAVAVPTRTGDEYVALTGNEIGIVLAYYLLTQRTDSQRPLVMTTIVSSPLLRTMAHQLNAEYDEVLTGFKWIANRAIQLEAQRNVRFLMGYEEALGYTIGTRVRDKDGISAAAMFAEIAAHLKAHGKTMLDFLEEIYRRFGFVVSKQHNTTKPGMAGIAAIQQEMRVVRQSPPRSIGSYRLIAWRDYLAGMHYDLVSGSSTKLELPSSNVIAFDLEDGSRITLRPSGTEPKIKYYFDVYESLHADESFESGRTRALAKCETLAQIFFDWIHRINNPNGNTL